MVAYVGIAPLVGAVADRIPRRTLMVAMDITRAGVALALPFVTQVWQIYVLIFLLQAASAAFTPTFQATIPEVLPAERDYTRALSLSRLAYDLESLFSPALAAGLLTLISYNWPFVGTAAGFLASAALVVSVALPKPAPVERSGAPAPGPSSAPACSGRPRDSGPCSPSTSRSPRPARSSSSTPSSWSASTSTAPEARCPSHSAPTARAPSSPPCSCPACCTRPATAS